MLKLAHSFLGSPINRAIALALTTGMRRGEICALRWSDLNENGTITVSRALGVRKGGYYEKEPKTRESRRTIPLAPWLYSYLVSYRDYAREDLRMIGAEFGDPYILGTQEPKSKPYTPNKLSREFKAFCSANGFDCSFHDLRHTFASMLIAEGVDVEQSQAI